MSRAASVFELPDDFALPPVHELINDRPTTWLGMPVHWARPSSPTPVFLRKFDLGDKSEATEAYLFGARHSISEALVGGESFGDEGFFIEYFAIDRNPAGGWNAHRLRQRGASVVYSDREEETRDCVPAREIADPSSLSIEAPPAWKLWAADWPTCDGKPMRFVGQVKPPENDVTRELLSWVSTIYFFWSPSDEGSRYKIVEHDRGAQTAEEHYELEEQLNRAE